MKRSDFRFLERLRVRWAEVDMQKIVFNGHYLMYFDTAVAGYWRALAMPYHETMVELAGDFYVRKATVEYLGSARYDDRCEVGIRCERLGNSSMTLVAAMFRAERLLVHGELLYVFADPATQTSRPLPQVLRDWFLAYEAGAPMVAVRCGGWLEHGEAVGRIRREVRADGPAAAPAEDGADADALHAVATNRLGMALATGRAVALADGRAEIGGLAVSAALRGAGIGRRLLEALLGAARERGHHEARVRSPAAALQFFAAAGFTPSGEPSEEAGEVCQTMVRPL